jgi:c(7)-type cytochrome triheme protein
MMIIANLLSARRSVASNPGCGLLVNLGMSAWLVLLALMPANNAQAEYGDIVINNFSDAAGMRPPIFPHWFHRIRFQCKICHADLGFMFKAGGDKINMAKIINGEFCGACHNGEIAWSVENCQMCHSAEPGTPTQVHQSTLQTLIAPLSNNHRPGGKHE